MNTRFEVFTSYNILQYLCDFIHVHIFVTVSKCRKSPKLTNIVMLEIFVQSSTSTGYFSNSTGSCVTNCRFSPIKELPCKYYAPMIGENQHLVADESVEF